MKVLIACEFSGVVRRAFRERGHDAWSCDRLPAEDGSPFHIQGDALTAIIRGCPQEHEGPDTKREKWNLIGIHYTCTFFCNSGVQWLYVKNPHGSGRTHEYDVDRLLKMDEAAVELARIWTAAITTGAKVYFENPVMHSHAAVRIERHCPSWSVGPSQWIEPCDYGHPETKKTGLWLHRLPNLIPTAIVRNEMAKLAQKDRAKVHYASPGKDRWKERSRTLPGIASAMAQQWGKL